MPIPSVRDASLRSALATATADKRLSMPDIGLLHKAVMDGGSISKTELVDLAKVRDSFTLSPAAGKLWAGMFPSVHVTPVTPLPETRSAVSVRAERSEVNWEGYVHFTPAPHWRFERWSDSFVPNTVPNATDIRQGSQRFLEFAPGKDSPSQRVLISPLAEGTRYLASTSQGSWRLNIAKQGPGLPYLLTLTLNEPGGMTGPNSRRHLGTTKNWSMTVTP